MYLQRTVKNDIECSSIGLHSGRKVSMRIRPAGVDEGITFVRTDLPGNHAIKADITNVCDTTLATTIGNNGSAVSTVEHLMSAFSGMGVDNAVIEVNAPEVPIMDGSALPFVNMLKMVGTRLQGKCKKLLVIKEAISVEDETGTAMLLPASEFTITYKIDFKHPLIGQQSYHLAFSVKAIPTPNSRLRSRNGRSVIPAMGARNTLFFNVKAPIFISSREN